MHVCEVGSTRINSTTPKSFRGPGPGKHRSQTPKIAQAWQSTRQGKGEKLGPPDNGNIDNVVANVCASFP